MGTSTPDRKLTQGQRDHPHAYGDKYVSRQAVQRPPGSSPRVWGQAVRNPNARTSPGIIPTRMGTSEVSAEYLSIKKDHPHAYGDKRNFLQLLQLSIKDHPHAYGDKRIKKILKGIAKGSSPRVWGQDLVCLLRF